MESAGAADDPARLKQPVFTDDLVELGQEELADVGPLRYRQTVELGKGT